MAPDVKRCEFRLNIFAKLKQRNEEERTFSQMVLLTNSMREVVDFLKKENHNLKIQNENIEQRNPKHVVPGYTDSSSCERVATLERKIHLLHEELTEVHRKRGEFAQQYIELKVVSEEKDKDLSAKCSELQEIQAALSASEEACKKYEQQISETKQNVNRVEEEYAALLVLYSNSRKRKLELDQEHQNLINQWMELKARDADIFNAQAEKK